MIQTSYDIIIAHGGELKIETKVDKGNPYTFEKEGETVFIIQLPFAVSDPN